MQFSENNETWCALPKWASFFVRLGYVWAQEAGATRKIAVLSLPFDSASAGLIALGAMRKRMELDDANDLGPHFQRILEKAHKGDRIYLRNVDERGRYILDEIDSKGNIWAKKEESLHSKSGRTSITQLTAAKWRFDGEAQVANLHGEQIPNFHFYEQLIDYGAVINPKNLSESDSGVCLAGRSAGEQSTRNSMNAIHFRTEGLETTLDQLLTIHDWMPGTVSRVMFYNPRIDSFDRGTARPKLVVSDGDASFLKVLSKEECEKSDVIGVINRTVERDKLEAIGEKLAHLRQWYDPIPLKADPLTKCPKGIAITILLKKMEA